MSKTNAKAPRLAAPKKPSKEEIKQQQLRALMQQRNGMVQTFAVNIVSNNPLDVLKEAGAADVIRFAAELADASMEEFYGKKEAKEEA
jgi:hypothetical protein